MSGFIKQSNQQNTKWSANFIFNKIIELEANLRELQLDYYNQLHFSCGYCNKRPKLSEYVLVRELEYIPPRGCMGGDYYVFQNFALTCPKCKAYNRLHPYYEDRDKINRALKHVFRFVHFVGDLEIYENEKHEHYKNFYTHDLKLEDLDEIILLNSP